MRQLFYTKKIILLLLLLLTASCTEQYVLQTNTFDDALVIEATITNELKRQEIFLTRTYRFEDGAPVFESGAEVYITDNSGNRYDFEESGEKYLSLNLFQAEPEKVYRLNIATKNGRTYSSTSEKMAPVNNMQEITTAVETVRGDRGVSINVKSFDPSAASKYYRYEFEETYKIIAPYVTTQRAITVPGSPGEHEELAIISRDGTEITTCYKTELSQDIILATTNDQTEDRIDFPVRFIDDKDPIIANRYSILIRQYVQNLPAYTYYKTLKDLSGSGSILSQNQPGFFYGNIKSNDDPNEKVIGFFDVSTVSSKRVFFNYIDLFPGEPKPPYFVDCTSRRYKYCFTTSDPECRGMVLLSIVSSQSMQYIGDENGTFYYMVSPPCVDCTKISSNIKPSFWID